MLASFGVDWSDSKQKKDLYVSVRVRVCLCVCMCPDVMFQVVLIWQSFSFTAPAALSCTQSACLSVCLSVGSKTADHHETSSLWLLTCGGLWDDRGPGQSGSGEKDIVTFLSQFKDATQHNTLIVTDTHKHKQSLF